MSDSPSIRFDQGERISISQGAARRTAIVIADDGNRVTARVWSPGRGTFHFVVTVPRGWCYAFDPSLTPDPDVSACNVAA